MRLLIAVPSFDTIRAEFFQSVMDLTKWLWENHIDHEVKIHAGSLVYAARDKLARYAIKNKFDEVLWIDSDMVFDGHLYDDLKMCGKDMVCGLFISRHHPYVSCIFSEISPVERITEFPDETFEVMACGFGCVLMKTKVLEDVMNQNSGVCFLPDQKKSEDVAFCMRARGCGYRIFCEPTARVGHVGSVVIWPEDAERLRGDTLGLDGKKLN